MNVTQSPVVVRMRKDRREIVGFAVESCPVGAPGGSLPSPSQAPSAAVLDLVAWQEVRKNTNILLARHSGGMTDVH